jgi:hypothetical protein
MTTRRVRFSVVSSKPFQEILASLKSAVGHPDMAEFARAQVGEQRRKMISTSRELSCSWMEVSHRCKRIGIPQPTQQLGNVYE